MRSILNGEIGNNLLDTPVPELKWKFWNSTHIEVEFQLSRFGRYPVIHCLMRPNNRLLIGGSFENRLDFVFDMNFFQFSNLDYGFPKTAKLFRNTFSKKHDDVFLTRAIEPYCGQVQWFLCIETENHGPSSFTRNNFVTVMEQTDKLFPLMTGMIEFGDKLIDDLNPSWLGAVGRGIMRGNRTILEYLINGVVGSIAKTPKWAEMMTEVADMSEKIEAYKDRFCIDDLYNAFSK